MSVSSPTTRRRTARPSPRERLLATAGDLFAAHGIHAVGIDRILRESGVAKASMYHAFASKDGLVAAYVAELDERDRRRWADAVADEPDPTARVLALFDLAAAHQEGTFRGCQYLNVAAEYPRATTADELAVWAAIDAHRAWFVDTVGGLLRQAGREPADAEEVARRLRVLYDGALAGAKLARDTEPLTTARDLAAGLLGA